MAPKAAESRTSLFLQLPEVSGSLVAVEGELSSSHNWYVHV